MSKQLTTILEALYFDARWNSHDPDGWETAKAEAEAKINQYIAEILTRIEQSIDQHTVPESTRLVTRQYVRNTIEFERRAAGIETRSISID